MKKIREMTPEELRAYKHAAHQRWLELPGNREKYRTQMTAGVKKWRTPTRMSFFCAKNRCTNPNNTDWKHYGARGIKFLFTSVEQLIAEIGSRPEEQEIDRINNDGNYEPGNVRWATRSEQCRNKRKKKSFQAVAIAA